MSHDVSHGVSHGESQDVRDSSNCNCLSRDSGGGLRRQIENIPYETLRLSFAMLLRTEQGLHARPDFKTLIDNPLHGRAEALRAPREAAATETQTASPLQARSKERCFVTSARGSSVQVCGVGGHLALHLGQPDWRWELHDASSVRTPSPMKIYDLTGGDGPGLLQGIWEERDN